MFVLFATVATEVLFTMHILDIDGLVQGRRNSIANAHSIADDVTLTWQLWRDHVKSDI